MHDDRFELPDDAAVDFRDAAARESLRIVQGNRGVLPPNHSLCLAATDGDPQSLRQLTWTLVAALILGLGLVIGGCLFGAASERRAKDGHAAPWQIALALAASVGGIVLLCSGPWLQRRFTRGQIGARYDELLAIGGGRKPRWASVEEAVTFHRMKFVAEDVAFVAFDPAARLIAIEGARHRYRIYADDVLSVGQIPGSTSTATAIAFQIGEVQLAIALQSNSLWHEFKKQTIGAKRDPLLRRIQETLGRED